jgi:hypothetical protein
VPSGGRFSVAGVVKLRAVTDADGAVRWHFRPGAFSLMSSATEGYLVSVQDPMILARRRAPVGRL